MFSIVSDTIILTLTIVSEAGASGAPILLVREREGSTFGRHSPSPGPAWSGHYGRPIRSGYSCRRTGPARASSKSPQRIRPIGW
ncbi:UNVERIFIED_CONTAM: hypothetical protein Slati_1508600 [Sesamum latifolium]|uniref:Secreted protein n=1 Tax=Sesamum latifolium TaxID=2727402 RepID=A0AAW2X9Q1_9LAMI